MIIFDDMIVDMISNKNIHPLASPKSFLFIRVSKFNISLVFMTQSFFAVPNDVRLNTTHFFIMKNLD